MGKNEIEIIKYPKIKHVKMFVNEIKSVDNHVHNDFEISLCLKGNASFTVNGNEFSIVEGDVFFINSGDVHAITNVSTKSEVDKNFEDPIFLFIQISNHFVRDYFPQIRTSVFKSGNLKSELSEKEYKILLYMLTEAALNYFAETKYYELEIVSCVSKALTFAYKSFKPEIINENQKQKINRKSSRLERIISYIDENFDSQIRLEDIASKENLSVTHFSHLFSSNFGMTFQEFINIKRMEQCIRLMANKEKTLLEISYESGFSDPKYMNRIFLKKFGCTPKEYRKKYSMHTEDNVILVGKLETIFNDNEAYLEVKKFADKNELEFIF